MIWCNHILIFIIISNLLLIKSENSSIWLLNPASRNEEQNSETKRLPESLCPTPQNPEGNTYSNKIFKFNFFKNKIFKNKCYKI